MSELLPALLSFGFTLPHELNPLIIRNRKALFKLLLMPLPKPLSIMGMPTGADCGITMVLHTWGQQLNFHPHVHCIVTEVV
jgi:hypothetical protein